MKATEREDLQEIDIFTQSFEYFFKERLDLESYIKNEFQDYLGSGAQSIYVNPAPKDFKVTKWRKNPKEGMLWLSTSINPNGITGKDDIGRTYDIKFEQKFDERRKYARNWGTGMTHHFYGYGRTVEEVLEQFEAYLVKMI